MKILSAAAIALLLLAGCSTTPDPTPSHPTWCNKDPKKEPHFHDCNGNLYLPGHEPEECIPEEPPEPVVQKPVEPPKPDPIVGTYQTYPTGATWWSTQSVLRVYADGGVKSGSNAVRYRWKKNDGLYQLFMVYQNPEKPEKYHFSLQYQDEEGEPEISTTEISYRGVWNYFEGIKLSSDPDFQFDLFHLGRERGEKWVCKNVGRGEESLGVYKFKNHPPHSAPTLAECEAQCRPALEWQYSHHGNWTYDSYRGNRTEEEAKERMKDLRALATCPQDRR